MPASSAYQWVVLAEKFPCGLANFPPATEIGTGATPACTGVDMGSIGYLKTGTVPTGATRTVKSYTISGTAYEWHFRRLWRVSANKLIWGALDYTTAYFPQDRGEIDLPESGDSPILKMLPVGTSLVIFTAAGAHVLTNANDPGANFRQVDLIEEATITDAGHAVELNGLCYFCNANGFYSMTPDGDVTLLSGVVDGNAAFQSRELKCKYADQYIVFAGLAAYSVPEKKFFTYTSDATFSFESPHLRQPSGEPFACRAVAFDVEHDPADVSDKALTLACRFGDREWTEPAVRQIPYERANMTRVLVNFDTVESARTFALRITGLSSGLWIKRIYAEVSGFTQRSRED